MIRPILVNSLHTELSYLVKRAVSYYVSTPIFYVNSSPHIGHLYTLLAADAQNIYHRLKLQTNDTTFSSGTDEHGIKIQTAAEHGEMPYQKFCDFNTSKFYRLVKHYDIGVTNFIRTTNTNHMKAVQNLWRELDSKGFIYRSLYSGWYCVSDEVFIPESQIVTKTDGGVEIKVDAHDNVLKWTSEENYMFRISKVLDKVHEWLSMEKPVHPAKFNDEAIRLLELARKDDLSISRPQARLRWGIPVPDDPSHTIYVWMDALTNYLTTMGYPCSAESLKRWPIDCQILGKDILKFHAVYWPAFLVALGLPLPKRLLCHSHWLIDSYKMSKSKGNVVDPFEEDKILTIEGLRYYLLRCGTFHSDTDYNRTQAILRLNAELCGIYGNLLSRCAATAINPDQIIPTCFSSKVDYSTSIQLKRLDDLKATCETYYDYGDYYKAVDEIMSVIRVANSLYEVAKPWILVKELGTSEDARIQHSNIQALTFETLRICSLLLQPIVPKISKKALNRMSVSDRNWSDAHVKLSLGDPSLERRKVDNFSSLDTVLFPRLKVN